MAPAAMDTHLREGMAAATGHLWIGLVVVAVLAVGVLFVVPRRFPVLDRPRQPAEAAPAAEASGAA